MTNTTFPNSDIFPPEPRWIVSAVIGAAVAIVSLVVGALPLWDWAIWPFHWALAPAHGLFAALVASLAMQWRGLEQWSRSAADLSSPGEKNGDEAKAGWAKAAYETGLRRAAAKEKTADPPSLLRGLSDVQQSLRESLESRWSIYVAGALAITVFGALAFAMQFELVAMGAVFSQVFRYCGLTIVESAVVMAGVLLISRKASAALLKWRNAAADRAGLTWDEPLDDLAPAPLPPTTEKAPRAAEAPIGRSIADDADPSDPPDASQPNLEPEPTAPKEPHIDLPVVSEESSPVVENAAGPQIRIDLPEPDSNSSSAGDDYILLSAEMTDEDEVEAIIDDQPDEPSLAEDASAEILLTADGESHPAEAAPSAAEIPTDPAPHAPPPLPSLPAQADDDLANDDLAEPTAATDQPPQEDPPETSRNRRRRKRSKPRDPFADIPNQGGNG